MRFPALHHRLRGKVDEGFVHDQPDLSLFCPGDQAEDVSPGDIVSRGIVRVDDDQIADVCGAEEVHDLVGAVAEIRILRLHDHHLILGIAVGVLLEGGADHSQPALHVLHQELDQLRRAVAGDDLVLAHAEVSGSQQGVDVHPRRVLADQAVKVGLHLVQHLSGRIVAVDQVTEIQHFGIAPVAAVAPLDQGQALLLAGEQGLGDVQILDVVDLVPLLGVVQALGLDAGVIQHDDDLQDLLVVLVVAQGLGVGVQEGNVVGGGEGFAEFIEVHGLIIFSGLPEGKLAAGDHGLNVVALRQLHAGAVHPGLVPGHQGQAVPGIVRQALDHGILKNDVGLQEQGVLRHQVLAGQGQGVDVVGLVVDGVVNVADGGLHVQGGDVIPQLLSLVAGDDDDPGQIQPVQLSKGAVDEGDAVDLHHALGVVAGQLLQAFSHACG